MSRSPLIAFPLAAALLAAAPAFAGGIPKPPPVYAEELKASPKPPAPPKAEKPKLLDIRAFGDAGYIGGFGSYAAPRPDWVQKRLKGVEMLRSADVNFLNLEGSLTRSCEDFEGKTFSFAIAPEALLGFAQWGFNLIGLANNHSLDCLDPAPSSEVNKALAFVRKSYPKLAAHGVASTHARLVTEVARFEKHGIRLGMVSLKAWDTGLKSYVGNSGNRYDLFRALKKADVDVRILSLHGGVENTRRPTVELMDIARDFVARFDGDIVFAHHPHKSQGVEVIGKPNGKTAVVFYSLGNFLHNGLSANGDGVAARVAVSTKGVDADSLALFPLGSASRFPRPAGAKEGVEALAILKTSSAAIAQRPLPKGLKRVPFSLRVIQQPALGLRLEMTPAENPPAKPGATEAKKRAKPRRGQAKVSKWFPKVKPR